MVDRILAQLDPASPPVPPRELALKCLRAVAGLARLAETELARGYVDVAREALETMQTPLAAAAAEIDRELTAHRAKSAARRAATNPAADTRAAPGRVRPWRAPAPR